MKCLWTKIKQRAQSVFKNKDYPKLTVPESWPLSPCIIDPYVNNEGKEEENKAYIPVSLLIRALDNDRMLNIAVAGNYGVGKSSIINTAERQVDKRHKFIRISLASLLTKEGKDSLKKKERKDEPGLEHKLDTKDGTTIIIKEEKPQEKDLNSFAVSDKQIEYSILQQILYHDRPQETPKSRIRRIHKTNKSKPYWIALGVFLILVSLVFLLKPAWFIDAGFINLDDASELVRSLFKWVPIVVLATAIVLICRYCSRHYTFSLSRIGYKNIEMKITDEMSIFNAYLDEIVYFFESTKYDVVVFEDLDRFLNKEIIFYKLRELNTILNNCQSLGRKINFVYAVLDHLFDATERVKFFDYIITVIPVINSLNSYEKLKESISPPKLFDELGHTELHNLCDYLQDMRMLLNIVNEFNQLSPLMDKMDKSVMSYKVLFGLMVYKNYAPEDFSKMYNKEGIVAQLIEGADDSRNLVVETIEKKVADLREKIHSFEQDYNQNLKSLRKTYLEKGKELSDYAARISKIQVAGTPYTIDSIVEQQGLFNAVRAGQASYMLSGSGTVSITPFETIEANFGGIGHFEAESKRYKADLERYTEEAHKKIAALQEELLRLPVTVSGIYQKSLDTLDEALQGLIDLEKIRLVKFLLLNGYLDRYYQYYISYFYSNSLKREDQTFVMRAGRHEGPQFDVKLEEIEEVMKRFTPDDFATNMALLNVDIVRALFNKTTHVPNAYAYKSAICSLISKENCFEFLMIAYRSSNPVPDAFYSMVLRQYDYWDQIDGRVQSEQDELHEIYLKYCNLQEGKVNQDFLKWLFENYAFIDRRWESCSMERIDKLFKTCNPVFKTLSLKNTPEIILNDIIENKRYVVSRQNVNAIVAKLGFLKEYRTAAYTTLRNNKSTILIQTLEADWPNTLSKVFPDTSIHEDASAIVSILNSAQRYPSKNEFKTYLSRQRNRIYYADLLSDGILKYAYEQSFVQPTWRNVYYYAITKGYGLPYGFLHNNTFRERVGDSLNDVEEENLRKRIVFSNDVKITDYKKLVPLFSGPFTSIPSLVQPARMKILLENNLLAFNEGNYQVVREHYSLSSQFIVNNLDVFLSNPTKYEIDKSDVHAVWNALPTKKAKCDFIRAIKDIDLSPDAELASIIRPFVVSSDIKTDELGSKLLLAIISGAPDDLRIIIGRRAIVSLPYEREMTTLILAAMGNEFNRLTTNTSTSTIPYSRDAIYICNELVRLGYVKACEKKGNKILITKV